MHACMRNSHPMSIQEAYLQAENFIVLGECVAHKAGEPARSNEPKVGQDACKRGSRQTSIQCNYIITRLRLF